jgi:predicted signal transduction protein with EAL and GGDEF domain
VDEDILQQAGAELAGRASSTEQLRQALENDEFTLYCQPILALAGPQHYPMAEVLVRMRQEETALLPPGDFFPVFEHYRMMPLLDRWVVRNTVKRIACGSRIGRFTVNLSGQTLEDAEFRDSSPASSPPIACLRKRCFSRSTKATRCCGSTPRRASQALTVRSAARS